MAGFDQTNLPKIPLHFLKNRTENLEKSLTTEISTALLNIIMHLLFELTKCSAELVCKVFLKLELRSGFHKNWIAPKDIKRTAFKTKHQHFQFFVMPLNLRSAAGNFQALMNTIFRDFIDEFLVI